MEKIIIGFQGKIAFIFRQLPFVRIADRLTNNGGPTRGPMQFMETRFSRKDGLLSGGVKSLGLSQFPGGPSRCLNISGRRILLTKTIFLFFPSHFTEIFTSPRNRQNNVSIIVHSRQH